MMHSQVRLPSQVRHPSSSLHVRLPRRPFQVLPCAVAAPIRPLDTNERTNSGTQLDQLKSMTMVVADTGVLDEVVKYKPQDCTTNPTYAKLLYTSTHKLFSFHHHHHPLSLVLRALANPNLEHLFAHAASALRTAPPNNTRPFASAADVLVVALGTEILKHIPGRVSSEVDAHLSYSTTATYDKALTLLDLYAKRGIDPSRVYIKIASTWEGIQACAALQKQGISCNMTLLFNMAQVWLGISVWAVEQHPPNAMHTQAVAAADAGASLISPFVGRIRDWHMKASGCTFAAHVDPGVVSVQRIYDVYKNQLKCNTIVMGASFRTADEIRQLAGCVWCMGFCAGFVGVETNTPLFFHRIDALTVSPALLEELQQSTEDLPRKLPGSGVHRGEAAAVGLIDQRAFATCMQEDAMARELLASGIASFTADQLALEAVLAQRAQG